MDSIVEIVAEYLTGVGLPAGYSLFRGFEPPKPDAAITLIEFAGPPPDTTFVADYPSFQVRVRSNPWEYSHARVVAQDLLNSLHARDDVVDSSVSPGEALVFVVAEQQPFPVLHDEFDRITFVFNCRSMRTT